MRTIKYFFIVLAAVVALFFIIAAILPQTFHAEGTVDINRPSLEVFNYIKYIEHQEQFGIWFMEDDKIEKTSEGEDGTVGFRYAWKSEKVGDGEQVITRIIEGRKVETALFFNGSTNAAKSYFCVKPLDDHNTKVVWAIDGSVPYPFNIMSFFYDMDKDFQLGTQNLKRILER